MSDTRSPLGAQALPTSLPLKRRLMAWLGGFAASPRCGTASAPLSAEAMLQQVLDWHPRSRGIFAHLAAVEDCLRREGRDGLANLRPGTLQRAREELVSVVGTEEAQPLLALLAEPAARPRPQAPRREAAAAVTAALSGIEHLEISEVNEETYFAALKEWEQSV